MITGLEAPCPKFLENYGLETIWRLKTDTKRRTVRLIKTLSLFFYGLLAGKFKYPPREVVIPVNACPVIRGLSYMIK